jgi:beta-glucuronidase
MADRDGILIWSDIPVTQQGNNQDPNQPGWPASARGLLAGNILANENHPSVLVWSIANELPTAATVTETTYVASAARLAHRLDPARLVGMAVSDWPGAPCEQAYAPLDAIGVNEYFGWYDAGGGTTDDRDALSPFLDSVRACYPNKALFITEFGFDGSRNGPIEERGTYQFQADAAAYHLGVFASKQWLSGAMYFVLQDSIAFAGYVGGNPWPDPPFNHKGLLDFQGNQKPAWKGRDGCAGSRRLWRCVDTARFGPRWHGSPDASLRTRSASDTRVRETPLTSAAVSRSRSSPPARPCSSKNSRATRSYWSIVLPASPRSRAR